MASYSIFVVLTLLEIGCLEKHLDCQITAINTLILKAHQFVG